MLISTYFKEATNAGRAEVLKNEEGSYYYIDYYDAGGNKFFTEAFPGKSVQYVEDAAENWVSGIKMLRG